MFIDFIILWGVREEGRGGGGMEGYFLFFLHVVMLELSLPYAGLLFYFF